MEVRERMKIWGEEKEGEVEVKVGVRRGKPL